jgi:hypothetical protein
MFIAFKYHKDTSGSIKIYIYTRMIHMQVRKTNPARNEYAGRPKLWVGYTKSRMTVISVCLDTIATPGAVTLSWPMILAGGVGVY